MEHTETNECSITDPADVKDKHWCHKDCPCKVTETNEYWRDVVIKWLHSEKSSALSYVGDFDRDNLDSVCLDGSFDLEELAKVLRQSDKELILGKMEKRDIEECKSCDDECDCKKMDIIRNETLDTCKSIVEEVMR